MGENRACPSPLAPAVRYEPCAPVSDDPKPSETVMLGNNSASRLRNTGDSGAPPEPIENSVDTS